MTEQNVDKVRLTDAEKALGEDVRDWGWMRGFTTEAVERMIAARVATAKAEVIEYDEQISYYAQFQDWSGKWCNASPGTAYSTSRDAVEQAKEMLGQAGYRDVSIRVVKVTQRRTVDVLQERSPSSLSSAPQGVDTGRCPFVNDHYRKNYARMREDGWRCGKEAGHNNSHCLYSSDGDDVLDAMGPWVLAPSLPSDPTTDGGDHA